MADCSPTVDELFKAKAVTDEQVNAAVEAYLADPTVGVIRIADGCGVDIAKAVEAHPFTRATLAGAKPGPSRKRKAIRAAILLARAQKA